MTDPAVLTETATTTATPPPGAGAWPPCTTAGVLDTYFPAPALGPAPGDEPPADLRRRASAPTSCAGCGPRSVRVEIDLDAAPADTADAYLRLHLLSHRLVAPRTINLDGIFGALPNVVWTSAGPVRGRGLRDRSGPGCGPRAASSPCTGSTSSRGWSTTCCRAGVRIADADRVRLGAHLAAGTTVMHEGFVNFNAGTLGTSMVEGRISAGVVVGHDSDIGGGASIMGTLSGGGKEVISVGERCLLGANAGIGIALGDDCVVEAGLYVTAATKVTPARRPGGQGPELSGPERAALHPQLGHRRDRGPPRRAGRGRAQRRPAPN